jgi:hypothetical protein
LSRFKKVLGHAQTTLSELRTIIVEIEVILNDRPLTYVSTDINDKKALTPSHLLMMDVVSLHCLTRVLMMKRATIQTMEPRWKQVKTMGIVSQMDNGPCLFIFSTHMLYNSVYFFAAGMLYLLNLMSRKVAGRRVKETRI